MLNKRLLKAKAQFYTAMATLEDAGVSLTRALRQSHPRLLAEPARAMADSQLRPGMPSSLHPITQ